MKSDKSTEIYDEPQRKTDAAAKGRRDCSAGQRKNKDNTKAFLQEANI